MKSTKSKKPRPRKPTDDCTIPPPIAAKDLPRLVLPRNDDEVRKIAEYVEWQANGETVEHAEKLSTEHVMGTKARVLGRSHRQRAILGNHLAD
jgi:hypothetical protein